MHLERIRNSVLSALDRYAAVLSLIAVALITAASLLPSQSAGGPGGMDKLLHLLAYAVAVMPISQLPHRKRIAFGIGVLVWSGVIEFVQPLVGRTASLLDFWANAVGILLGLFVGGLLVGVFFKKNA
ncbi:MAG: hypothetical protein AAFO72_12550 [Pseudomonadota bacterium]